MTLDCCIGHGSWHKAGRAVIETTPPILSAYEHSGRADPSSAHLLKDVVYLLQAESPLHALVSQRVVGCWSTGVLFRLLLGLAVVQSGSSRQPSSLSLPWTCLGSVGAVHHRHWQLA